MTLRHSQRTSDVTCAAIAAAVSVIEQELSVGEFDRQEREALLVEVGRLGRFMRRLQGGRP